MMLEVIEFALTRLCERQDLDADLMRAVICALMRGEASEVEDVHDILGMFFEELCEIVAEKFVAVFHLDDVALLAHRDVLVIEAMDGEAGVFVGIETLMVGEGDFGGVSGEDFHLVAAACELLCRVKRENLRARRMIGEELMNGEENSHWMDCSIEARLCQGDAEACGCAARCWRSVV